VNVPPSSSVGEHDSSHASAKVPDAARGEGSESTPLLIVSVILMVTMVIIFALLLYKEGVRNEFLQQLEEKEREKEKKGVPASKP
jgi:flagellar basal body-associated protein FliL